MASIPSNGYAEVMAGTNNYSGSNSFDGSCPRTAIPPVIGDDLTNKTYVDNATGGGIIGTLTDKGSLITGDGTQPVIFDQNPYQTALTTTTVYDWNSLAIGQSRDFTTTAPTLIPLGAGITITYSGTDSIKGTITAVAGTTITITITNLASASYSSGFLLQTALPGFTLIPLGSPYNLAIRPSITTPIPPNIPANTIITDGVCYVYNSGSGGDFFITLSGTNVVRGSSQTSPLPNSSFLPPVALSYSGANGGCFVGSTQVVSITVNATQPSVPGLFLGTPPTEFLGSLSGYTLSYGTGSIVIDDDICLIADATSATGLAWGVINTASIGAVTSVSGGVNIVMSGTIPAPVVNLRNPLTAELNMGSQSLRDSASAVGTSGQILSAGTGGQTLWTNAPSTNPTITDTNTNATYYPTFVAGSGTQPLLADISTGPISLNPSNGNFNVVNTMKLTQSQLSVGLNAGLTSQGAASVAIGLGAAQTSQGANCIAVGHNSGDTLQGNNAIAIGHNAGQGTTSGQGANAIAIGHNAGQASQTAGSICLNATGTALNPNQAGLFINPIRNLSTISTYNLQYDPTTNEVVSYYNNNNVKFEDFDGDIGVITGFGCQLGFSETGTGSTDFFNGTYETNINTGAKYRRGVISLNSGATTGNNSNLFTGNIFSYANIKKVIFGVVPHANEQLNVVPTLAGAGNITQTLGITSATSGTGVQTSNTCIWRMTSSSATVNAWQFVINNVVQYTLTITPTHMTAKWCRVEINVNWGGSTTATVSSTWFNLTDGTQETTGTYTITAGSGFPASFDTNNTVGLIMSSHTNNATAKYLGVDYVSLEQPSLLPIGLGTTETTGR